MLWGYNNPISKCSIISSDSNKRKKRDPKRSHAEKRRAPSVATQFRQTPRNAKRRMRFCHRQNTSLGVKYNMKLCGEFSLSHPVSMGNAFLAGFRLSSNLLTIVADAIQAAVGWTTADKNTATPWMFFCIHGVASFIPFVNGASCMFRFPVWSFKSSPVRHPQRRLRRMMCPSHLGRICG